MLPYVADHSHDPARLLERREADLLADRIFASEMEPGTRLADHRDRNCSLAIAFHAASRGRGAPPPDRPAHPRRRPAAPDVAATRPPTFSLTVLLTLGVCIGVNVVVYGVVEAVVLRPLPFAQPERLVTMYNINQSIGSERDRTDNSGPDYFFRRERMSGLEALAAFRESGKAAGGFFPSIPLRSRRTARRTPSARAVS